MEKLTHPPSLVDFWKIPCGWVSYDGRGTETAGEKLVVSMPPYENRLKPGFYQWDQAHFYAPVPGFSAKSGDISTAVKVDPTSGTVSLPFNIDQAVTNLLTERYIQQESDHSLICFARQLYYKLKPLLPRSVQVRIRQKAVNRMGHRKFPVWELDTSADLLRRSLLAKLLEVQLGSSIPIISFWPQGAEFCLLLTHDVETLAGTENILKMIHIEQKHGFRSVWNFVPEKYPLDPCILSELQASGFEIGVHGLCHDGRLFESYQLFQQRATRINEYLRQWGSVGFRSPSNLRNLDWISQHIQAEYDSSSVSTEWYGAQPGGCCTVFPFIYRGLVELPITLQQDFTLLDILKLSPQEALSHWKGTVQAIKQLNGLALINVHPDYMTSPDRLNLYEQFLEWMNDETGCWQALPKDAARWWLDRDASELSLLDGAWTVHGPARDRGVVMRVNWVEGQLAFNRVELAAVRAATFLDYV